MHSERYFSFAAFNSAGTLHPTDTNWSFHCVLILFGVVIVAAQLRIILILMAQSTRRFFYIVLKTCFTQLLAVYTK